MNRRAWIIGSLGLWLAGSVSAQVLITEFMAVNAHTLQDEDLDYPDWIEIHNGGASSVALGGWHLTDKPDNLSKWTFPATNLAAGHYLVVFASNKDRAVAGRPLHTDFKLDGEGEFLALVKPDGFTVASAFSPAYPVQAEDVSFGIAQQQSNATVILAGAACRAVVPTNDLGLVWTARTNYDDSAWLAGVTGLGYDKVAGPAGYASLIGLNVYTQMFEATRGSAYLRVPFVIGDPVDVDALVLNLKVDDGMVAYINGTGVAATNAPVSAQWSDSATGSTEATSFLPFLIGDAGALLVAGTNMLAIHGLAWMNDHPAVADFLVLPKLDVVQFYTDLGAPPAFLGVPTPGAPNTTPIAGVCGEPVFSRPSGAITNTLALTITSPDPGGVVRYTLDGSPPSAASPVAGGPLAITNTALVRARCEAPNRLTGAVVSQFYMRLAPDVFSFNSNLPLLLIDSFGFDIDAESNPDVLYPKRSVFTLFIETNGTTRAAITDAPQVATRGAMIVRGSSTSGQPKHPYAFWSYDEEDLRQDVEPLGMPPEDEWALYPPYGVDRAFMRNALVFSLSRQMGRYASRTRFCEVLFNMDGGTLSAADYRGVYGFVEKIKRDANRIDIAKLDPSEVTAPDITGGYIFKRDRLDPGETGAKTVRQTLALIEPSEADLKAVPAQWQWFTNHLQQMENALYAPTYTNPVTGLHYTQYLERDSWLDYNALEMMAKNADALRLSAYFHKDREGLVRAGPHWDFDRSMESTDYRDDNFNTWDPLDGIPGLTNYYFTGYAWWDRIFSDQEAWQRYIDRWQMHRAGPLQGSNVTAVINGYAALLAEASVRDIARWPANAGRPGGNGLDGTWTGEVAHLTWWVTNRLNWIDSQFLPRPVPTPAGGALAPGQGVMLSIPPGTAVYYTLDGTDPRLPGGGVSPRALPFVAGQAIPIPHNALLRARATDGTAFVQVPDDAPWSGLTEAIYALDTPALAITELMVHARRPVGAETNGGMTAADFEFVELRNLGTRTVGLAGVRFTSGIDFDFSGSAVRTLAPGATVVVVDNLEAFKRRYSDWAALPVAGEFGGDLDNDGERVVLTGALGEILAEFTYGADRGWPLAAAGAGHALEPRLVDRQVDGRLDYGGWWTAGAYRDGSPGRTNPAVATSVVVNEFSAHTDYAMPWGSDDGIELYNPTAVAIPLGGWYLSDDPDALQKWAIPATNVLAPYGLLAFGEVTGFHNPTNTGFGLDKQGEAIYVSQMPTSGPSRVADAVAFRAQPNGPSEGRAPDGGAWWYRLASTRGGANAAPVSHVGISEFMYHPAPTSTNPADSTNDEYVELHNPLTTPVSLMGEAGPWRLAGAIAYSFPTGVTLVAGERVLVLPFDPTNASALAAFDAHYGSLPPGARCFGPYAGRLSNHGERLALEQPLAPDLVGQGVAWMIEDEVIYFDRDPWPVGADGLGYALLRLDATVSGCDPQNWYAGAATPGAAGGRIHVVAPGPEEVVFAPAILDVRALVDPAQLAPPLQQVAFYAGTNRLGALTAAPFLWPVALAEPGRTVFQAELVDAAGTSRSPAVAIHVLAVSNVTALGVSDSSAELRSVLAGPLAADVRVYYGMEDGGTDSGAWGGMRSVGTCSNAAFSLRVDDLQAGTTYYTRVEAYAGTVSGWSPQSTTFTTPGFDAWPYRAWIRFDGYTDPDVLANFPALVRFGTNLPAFDYATFGGHWQSLRFTDEGGARRLNHEVDVWNTNGDSCVWVQIPALTNGTAIRAYWGGQGVTSPPPYTQDGSTWSEGFQGVWHLNADGADATHHGFTVAPSGTVAGVGVIGEGRVFNGISDALDPRVPTAWYGSAIGNLTISFWAKPDAGVTAAGTGFGADGTGTALYAMLQTNPHVKKWLFGLGGQTFAGEPYVLGTWQRVSLVLSNGTAYALQNTNAMVTLGAYTGFSPTNALLIGNRGGLNRPFLGAIDDVQVSGVARSPAWLRAAYRTALAGSAFATYGAVEVIGGDTDGDGLPDGWEREHFGGTAGAGTNDWDADGLSDEEEYLAGTSPTNAASLFAVDLVTSNGVVQLRVPMHAAEGEGYQNLARRYDVQRAPALPGGDWQLLNGYSNIPGENVTLVITNVAAGTNVLYYRSRATLFPLP